MATPIPFGKVGNRGLARLAMRFEVSLVMPQRNVRTVVENTSREGCCLQLTNLPRIGLPLVRIEEVKKLGTVRWAQDQRCGVTFASQLASEAVERFCWIVDNFRDHEEADIASKSAIWR